MGPLALMAKAAGFSVVGSDLVQGAVSKELEREGIRFFIGRQDGEFLREELEGEGVDWFVYTSALPKEHAELKLAKERGIRVSKRDELIEFLVEKLGLKMVAVAGTHGKTTTSAGIVWLARKLKLPVSWLVGTTLGFEEAGKYVSGSKYLVYEADEYDRNFLYYHPWLSLIPAVSYDHPDIYPTEEDYKAAFAQFIRQSRKVITETALDKQLTIPGKTRRFDLGLGIEAAREIMKNLGRELDEEEAKRIMDEFPGVGRRMERIVDGVFSDYAHHPEEIKATLEMAREEAKRSGRRGVIAVYEPHQNTRQHEVFRGYRQAFLGAEKVFWLPTYLTREKTGLKVLTPEEFIQSLENFEVAEAAEVGEELYLRLKNYVEEGFLVLFMSAGPVDGWVREKFGKKS